METKDASSLTNSSVSDLDKTMAKKPFRINSKASIGVTTEDRRTTKDSTKDMTSSVKSPLTSQSHPLTKKSAFRLRELDENEQENSQLSLVANNLLMTRVKEDKLKYQQFLERLGLMKYYDQLWDLGVDSLEGLSKVTVEDFNHLYIPAGVQIKLQLELKKAGLGFETQTKEMGLDTSDLPGKNQNGPELGQTEQPKKTSKLNFGIKMRADPPPPAKQMCTMSIETDPIDDDNIPLNVDEDVGPLNHRLPPSTKEIVSKTDPFQKQGKAASSSTDGQVAAGQLITSQSETKEAFNFASIGGSDWVNCFDDLYQGNEDSNFSAGNYRLSSQGYEGSQANLGKKTRPPSTRVACYGCFRQMEPEEAFDHRHMPGKVASSNAAVLLEGVHAEGV